MRPNKLTAALKWLELAERLVNEDPTHGPGAPHVPGLCELRTGIGFLREALEPWPVPDDDRARRAVVRERDRLRDLLDRAHASLHDALNATPLDSPEGTASGFEYERQQRALRDQMAPMTEVAVLARLDRMSGRGYSGASVREAIEHFEILFWARVGRPLTAPGPRGDAR